MKNSEHVYYEVIKSRIKTDIQNVEMFSTDDQEQNWSIKEEDDEKNRQKEANLKEEKKKNKKGTPEV